MQCEYGPTVGWRMRLNWNLVLNSMFDSLYVRLTDHQNSRLAIDSFWFEMMHERRRLVNILQIVFCGETPDFARETISVTKFGERFGFVLLTSGFVLL
jgi:hypothetical protein